jgi:hypothetical protein
MDSWVGGGGWSVSVRIQLDSISDKIGLPLPLRIHALASNNGQAHHSFINLETFKHTVFRNFVKSMEFMKKNLEYF